MRAPEVHQGALAQQAPQRVLSTLNPDGTRRWLRPKLSPGRFLTGRRAVGYALMALFVALPLIEINGSPAILLDVVHRRFTFFGFTFLPTDTALLMLLLLIVFLGIFWVTAMFGRVWCGWGCPQTVYMELLFRPLERLIEGSPSQQKALDRKFLPPRRLLKHAVFAALAVVLANVFLAYFVGWANLWTWITGSPTAHPGGFAVVAVTAGLIFFDFGFFREQMCVVACPYARLQSVLLDKKSLVVGYNYNRGEPRGKRKRGAQAPHLGDCIDCNACVVTCPTGIDIRDGLQMECIGCAQCIDACDAIMDRVGKPHGLIGYTSQAKLEAPTKKVKLLRPRVLVYPALMAGLLALLLLVLGGKANTDVTVLRGISAPYEELAHGQLRNALRVRLVNRGDRAVTYTLSSPGLNGAAFVAAMNPVEVKPNATATVPVFVTVPSATLVEGKREITVQVTGSNGFEHQARFTLLGPHKQGAQGANP